VTRVLELRRDLGAAIRLGHPWIYREALVAAGGARGEIVDVRLRRGPAVARGWFDPDGPIAVRVLGEPGEPIDDAFVRARVAAAARLRAAAAIDADGLRLLNGEGDRLPGLVLDWYAGVGALRLDGASAAALWRPRAAAIAAGLADAGYRLDALHARGGRDGAPGELLLGALPSEVVMREGGARYEIDVARGQKTGFFLDQRDNRRRVAELAAGATLLNLFCYTGGFSIAAALAGARATTSVDSAAPAIEAARRNLARNRLDRGHELVVDDVRRFLAGARGRRWDIVVCDPPSFAPSARVLPRALAAYRDLNRAAAAAVAPGGLLVTASCSSHVTPAHFAQVVAEALADRPRARVLEARGAGIDHPVPPAFPEGRYLKLLIVAL
jgi:23S rRNA (cytosine1962-C5)-methyltransferase